MRATLRHAPPVRASLALTLTLTLTLAAATLACNSSVPAPAGPGGGVDAGAAGDTLCGDVTLSTTRTVPAGQTLTVCAGSTLTAAAADVTLTVQGTLVLQGTAQSPVKLGSAQGGTSDWGGLIIVAGGAVSATYVEIRNASIALAARAGSAFDIDHLVIESSAEMLILSAGGSIAHGVLHGLGDNQYATPVLINSASPRITDTVVDQALYLGIDMIVVGGTGSAPIFDHLEVADSHCAFHFDSGNGATISNSSIHHNAYGLMVIDSVAGHVVHNNFQDNLVNIGSCDGDGSTEVRDNFFVGDAFDSSCAALAVSGAAPSDPYTTGVGPAP